MNSGIAVVTGANKGLGYSTVKQLCKKYKGTVYLTSRDEKRGIEAFEKLKTSRDNLQYYHQLDVSDENSIKEFCKHLEKERKTIDILVNNAGVLFLKDSKEPKLYQAEQTVLINFFALVNFTEAVLPFINDNASIVNISSSSGHLSRVSDSLRSRISDPNLSLDGLKQLMKEYIDDVKLNKEVEKDWGETPYVVSKVAVNAYTFQLNRRLKNRGIRVNCVHPGYVISDMTRGAGKVTPDLAAGLVVTVAMETAGGTYVWSNGQRVPWDGTDPRGYIDNSAKVVQPSLLSME